MTATLIEDLAAGWAPPIREITVSELQKMIAAGVIAEGESIELIDGMLVRKDRRDPGAESQNMMTHGPGHATVVRRIQRAFARWQPNDRWHLSAQLPVRISEFQAPEPDTALLQGSPDQYDDRHPNAGDVLAVIEVSGASLKYDRSTKLRLYADAGIPLYLIVNLQDRRVERHEAPDQRSGQFQSSELLVPGESLRLELPGDPGIEIPVADLLPAADPPT